MIAIVSRAIINNDEMSFSKTYSQAINSLKKLSPKMLVENCHSSKSDQVSRKSFGFEL
jgi:hypothetical protein